MSVAFKRQRFNIYNSSCVCIISESDRNFIVCLIVCKILAFIACEIIRTAECKNTIILKCYCSVVVIQIY